MTAMEKVLKNTPAGIYSLRNAVEEGHKTQ
jgi:hypothetical protein